MDKEIITLIAAVIAAFASFLTLAISIMVGRAGESREVYRKTLEPYIHDLSVAIHEISATTNIFHKMNTGESYKNWRLRSLDAQQTLKDIRSKVRYPLWGIDVSIGTLSKLPDWIDHVRTNPKSSKKMLRYGMELSEHIDEVVMRAFIYGRPPTLIERTIVHIKDKSLQKIRRDIMQIPKEDRQ